MTDYPPNEELVESTSPAITSPVVLDSEATKPVDIMARLNAEAAAIQTGPKRKGRPRGSKNRTTLMREAESRASGDTTSRIVRPIGRPRTPPPPPNGTTTAELTPEQIEVRRAIKHERIEHWQNTLSEQINENLMLALAGMGVPANLLYREGHAPVSVQQASRYTELGQMVAVKPMQISAYSKLIVELEGTDTGKKLGGDGGTSKAGIAIWGIVSLAATAQYAGDMMKFYKNLAPLLEAHRAAQMQQEQQAQQERESRGYES